jgi:hypothetical protein
VRKKSPRKRVDLQTAQSLASCYTDCAIQEHTTSAVAVTTTTTTTTNNNNNNNNNNNTLTNHSNFMG